jgi:hypothetical protein
LNLSLWPTQPQIIKSATPARYVINGQPLTYTLTLASHESTTLHLYDRLDSQLTWQGFVGDVPDTLTYADGAVTGTVTLSASLPLTVSFATRVQRPTLTLLRHSHITNTAYLDVLTETLMLRYPSNTVVHRVYDQEPFVAFLPLTLRYP